MCLYVCVRVCVYMCMYVCVRACVFGCMCARTCLHVFFADRQRLKAVQQEKEEKEEQGEEEVEEDEEEEEDDINTDVGAEDEGEDEDEDEDEEEEEDEDHAEEDKGGDRILGSGRAGFFDYVYTEEVSHCVPYTLLTNFLHFQHTHTCWDDNLDTVDFLDPVLLMQGLLFSPMHIRQIEHVIM